MEVDQHNKGVCRKWAKLPVIFLLLALALTCIDPYNPNIRGKEELLVDDGLITNENRSYAVRLTRTSQAQNDDPVAVPGASVSITDQNGLTAYLHETQDGIYRTDSLSFIAETGNAYTLAMKFPDGREYMSDPCVMYPVDSIDNLYFTKDQDISADNSEILDGIRIFLDSGNKDGGQYFRWVYDEWWKFKVPYPRKNIYINESDIPAVEQVKEVCYQHNGSDQILIHSTINSQTDAILNRPILFIPTDRSDRFRIRYCIDVKQFSMSETEYQFWENLKETNEGGGGIFDKQPFKIIGNVHNIKDASEKVLGYFQVSAVSEKRLYIVPSDIEELDLPAYTYDCEKIVLAPIDFPYPVTWDDIFDAYSQEFMFVEPVYDTTGVLIDLSFSTQPCAICTTRGSLTPPSFWTDGDTSQVPQ